MADLTQEQMLEMARVAGLRIPDEVVEHLTLRLNALLEVSAVLFSFAVGESWIKDTEGNRVNMSVEGWPVWKIPLPTCYTESV